METTLGKILKFCRNESSGIYFSDINVKLDYSVKFDIYDEEKQLASLVTNNKTLHTISLCKCDLKLKRKLGWINESNFDIFNHLGDHICNIYFFQPLLFRKNINCITFTNDGIQYDITQVFGKELRKSKAEIAFHIKHGDSVKCKVVSYKKHPFFFNPLTISLEGEIYYDDKFETMHLLCILQAIQAFLFINSDNS